MVNEYKQRPGEKRADFIKRIQELQAESKARMLEEHERAKIARHNRRAVRYYIDAEDQSIGDYEITGGDR